MKELVNSEKHSRRLGMAETPRKIGGENFSHGVAIFPEIQTII